MKLQTVVFLYLAFVMYVVVAGHNPAVHEEIDENSHQPSVLRRARQSMIQKTYNPQHFDVRNAQQQDQQRYRYLQQQNVDLKNARHLGIPRPQSYNKQERVVAHLRDENGASAPSPLREPTKMAPDANKMETVSVPKETGMQARNGWTVSNEPVFREGRRSLDETLAASHEILGIPTHRPVKKVTYTETNVANGETISTNVFRAAPAAQRAAMNHRISAKYSENGDLEYGSSEEREMRLENVERRDSQPVARLRVKRVRKPLNVAQDQKGSESTHGFSVTPYSESGNNLNFVATTAKPQVYHQNIHALSALLGKHPQQQLQGLNNLLGGIQQQDASHFHKPASVDFFELKDHTPITEHVSDFANPQSRPNIKIVTNSNSQIPQKYYIYQPDAANAGIQIQKNLFAPEVQKHTEALIRSQAEEFALKQAHVHQQLQNVAKAQEIANAKVQEITNEGHKELGAVHSTQYFVKQRVQAVDGERHGDVDDAEVSMKRKLYHDEVLQTPNRRRRRSISPNDTNDQVEYDLEYYEYDYDSDGNDTEVVYYDYVVSVDEDAPRFEKLVQTTTASSSSAEYYDDEYDYSDADITSTSESTAVADRRYIRNKNKPKFHGTRYKSRHRKRKRRPSYAIRHRYAENHQPHYSTTYTQVTPKPNYSFPDLKPTYYVLPTHKPSYSTVPSYYAHVKPSLPAYTHKSDKDGKEPTNVIVINNSNDNHNHGGNLHHSQYGDAGKGQGHAQHYPWGGGGHVPFKKGTKGRRKRVKKRKRPVVYHRSGPSRKHVIRITKKVNAAIHKIGHVPIVVR